MTALLLAFALVWGACGGGGKRLTRAEFLKEGNAICDKGNKETDAAAQKAFPNQNEAPDPTKAKVFFKETAIPSTRKQIDDIDALKPPKDLQDDVDKLLSDARDALGKIEKQVDQDVTKLLSDENDPFKDVDREAKNVGLTACASG
jgi:hypothetical protein